MRITFVKSIAPSQRGQKVFYWGLGFFLCGIFLWLYGCKDEPTVGNRLSAGRLSPGRLSAGRISAGRVSGNASNGFALKSTAISIMGADGKVQLAATTDAQGNFTIDLESLPEEVKFPIMLLTASTSGNTVQTSILTKAPGEGNQKTLNINPLTQVVSQGVLSKESSQTLRQISFGKRQSPMERLVASELSEITEDQYLVQGQTLTALALGEAVDFQSFYEAPYQARTEENPAGGNFQDVLIDTLGAQSSGLSAAEVLEKAADPNDPTFDQKLLEKPSFQVLLTGEAMRQGRDGNAIIDLTQQGIAQNSGNLLENSALYLNTLQSMVLSGQSSGITSQLASSALVAAGAAILGEALDSNELASTAAVQNVVRNTGQTAGSAIIAIGQQNQALMASGNLEILLLTTGHELVNVLNSTGQDLTQTLSDQTRIQTQLNNFGQTLAAPLSAALNSGSADSNARLIAAGNASQLDPEKRQLLLETIAKQVGQSLSKYLDQFSQGIPEEAQNTANNVAVPLEVSLSNVLNDQKSASLQGVIAENFINQVAEATLDKLQSTGLNFATTNLPSSAINIANNMATIALATAASAAQLTANSSSTDVQSSVATATVEQALKEAANLDLSQSLPASAATIVSNVSQVVGPAIASAVAEVSNRKGDSLTLLVKNAASEVTQQLKENGIKLSEPINDVQTLTANASQKATESSISLEKTFQKIEQSGVDLGRVTKSLGDSKLDAQAIQVVTAQVAESVSGNNNDHLKQAAESFTRAAAETAKTILKQGGSLEKVQESVAITVTMVQDVAQNGNFEDVVNSAKALTATAKTASESNLSVDQLIEVTRTVATAVSSGNTKDTTKVLSKVQENLGKGQDVALNQLVSQEQLANATQKQQDLTQQAQQVIQTNNQTLVQNQTAAQNAISSGQGLSSFNATVQVTTTRPPTTQSLVNTTTRPIVSTLPPSTIQVSTLPPTTAAPPRTQPPSTETLTTILVTTLPTPTTISTPSSLPLSTTTSTTRILTTTTNTTTTLNPTTTVPPTTTSTTTSTSTTEPTTTTSTSTTEPTTTTSTSTTEPTTTTSTSTTEPTTSTTTTTSSTTTTSTTTTSTTTTSTTTTTLPIASACTSTQAGTLFADSEAFGALKCDSRSHLTIAHTILWNGAGGPLLGDVTLKPGGTLKIQGTGNALLQGRLILAGGTLDIASSVTLAGTMTLATSSTLGNTSTFGNTGNFSETPFSTIHIAEGQTLNYSGANVPISQQYLRLILAGTLNKLSNFSLQAGGTLEVRGAGTLNSPIALQGGALAIMGNVTMTGDLIPQADSTIMIANTSIFLYLGNEIATTRTTLSLAGSGSFQSPESAIVIQSAGKVRLLGGVIVESDLELTGGTLEIAERPQINADITIEADSTIDLRPKGVVIYSGENIAIGEHQLTVKGGGVFFGTLVLDHPNSLLILKDDATTIERVEISTPNLATGKIIVEGNAQIDQLLLNQNIVIEVAANAVLDVAAFSGAGVVQRTGEGSINRDMISPVTRPQPPPGLFNREQNVVLGCQDNLGGSGCSTVYYSLNGQAPYLLYSTPIALSRNTTIKSFSVDRAGNREPEITSEYQIDPQPPRTTAEPLGNVFNSPQTITLVCEDGLEGSGCLETFFTFEPNAGVPAFQRYNAPVRIESTRLLRFFSRDRAGHQEAIQQQNYVIDSSLLTTNAQPSGGLFNAPVSVTLTCTKGAGPPCHTIYYTLDGSTPTLNSLIYSSPILINETTTLKFFARNMAGISESFKTRLYTIDTIPPSITLLSPASSALINTTTPIFDYTLSETGTTLELKLDESPLQIVRGTVFPSLLQGPHTLEIKLIDRAGNQTTHFSTFIVDTIPPPPPWVQGIPLTNHARPTWTWIAATINPGSGQFRVKLDDQNLNTGSFATTALSFTPAQNLTDGWHTLYVQERDEAGNWSGLGAFTLKVDTLALDAPRLSAPDFTNQSRPLWTWIGSTAGSGLFRFRLNDINFNLAATTNALNFTPASSLSPGANTLYLQEKDNKENWSVIGYKTVVIDVNPPLVTVTAPLSHSFFSLALTSLTISGTFNDPESGVVAVSLSQGSTQVTASVDLAQKQFNALWTSPLLAGTNTFQINVEDLAGNRHSVTHVIQSNTLPIAFVPSLTNNVIAAYSMDGHANDETRHNLDGIAHGGILATSDRLGMAGRAYAFDGNEDYIEVAHTSRLNLIGNFTLSAWIFQTATTTNPYGLFDKQALGTTTGYTFQVMEQRLRFCANECALGETTYPLNEWVHVAITVAGTTGSFYINGTLDRTMNLSERIANTLNFWIGGLQQGCHGACEASGFFPGKLDEVRLYNRALSTSELRALYAGDLSVNQWIQSSGPISLNVIGLDPDSQTLAYQWSVVSKPNTSLATTLSFSAANSATTFFTPDLDGTYILAVVVNDGVESTRQELKLVRQTSTP